DWSASYNRYHVDIQRTFSIGEPDPRWIGLLDRAAGSVEAVVKEMRPGDPMAKAHKIANEYIDSVGLRRNVWWIDGYDLGIAVPPDWVGHTFLGGGRFEEANFDVGVVTNFENPFDVVEEEWPGGRGAGHIESLLRTE